MLFWLLFNKLSKRIEPRNVGFYFGLIEGFEPKTCDVKVKEEEEEKEEL